MEKMTFQIQINATAALVYDKMLGLSDSATYSEWTTVFNPTSYYEGSWRKAVKFTLQVRTKMAKRVGWYQK